MPNDFAIRVLARLVNMPLGFFLFLIKAVQVLMLLAGLSAFLYGAYQLGMDLWFKAQGVVVDGYVIGHEEHYEERKAFPDGFSFETDYTSVPVYCPTIQYRWPPDNGELYQHSSTIQFEGDEMDRFQIGSQVRIRVLPDAPDKARLTGGFTHYLWAVTGFVAGLFAVVLVSSLFFMYEALFGLDTSRGLSLFRSLNWPATVAVLLVAMLGLAQFHQRVVPWLGVRELVALATGEMRLLPALLAAKGAPKSGQALNEAEQFFARMPWMGTAFASAAMEYALGRGDDAAAGRYLAALADPAMRFKVQSARVLAQAAERGRPDFVKALLAYGIHPDTALMQDGEPIRQAARRNHTAVMEVLLDAGCRTDYPNPPLMASAIEGRSADAVRLLLERTTTDPAWREPQTGHSLADLALMQGLPDIAELLKQRGAPVSLPGFYACVVTGDLRCLLRELPRSSWATAYYQDATLLHLAIRHHQGSLARQLVALGADPNAQIRGDGSEARTPLIETVLAGDRDFVRLLTRLSTIRINQGDYRHITPLAYAVRQGRWDLAEVLVEAGANVNVQIGDSDGNTPLHVASSSGDAQRVQWLLARGADSRMVNFRQLSALEVARTAEVAQIIRRSR